jgi:GntR family transcriptional regulator
MIDERLPLYQQLRDELAEKIARRVWRPGESIPTEAELAASHGIAVGTVRKAINALVADGLVEPQQGRGTFVRRPRFDSSLFRFFRHSGFDEHAVPGSRLLEREVVAATPDQVREALKLQLNERTIRMSRLRLAADRPFLREQIWLPYAQFEPLLTVPESEIGDLLYPAYERLCGQVVARAEEVLTVGAADADDSRLLGVERGAPLVMIDRLALSFEGRPIEWRRSHGVASDFRYKVEIC